MSLIKKYLDGYSDEVACDSIDEFYAQVLVIPAFRETINFWRRLRRFAEHLLEPALIIVVVNQPDDGNELHLQQSKHFIHLGAQLSTEKSTCPHRYQFFKATILVVGPLTLPKKQGVGLARKIGCDLALRLIDDGSIRLPIIFSTDADATLPPNYFDAAERAYQANKNFSAFIYPFIHRTPICRRQEAAIRLYEHRLNQFVEGLARAKSPYAFYTIGSTIAVNAHAYAAVRGFPKLAAGEDFYLLNKLRKVGVILNLSLTKPIRLSARASSRVPFGTGPSIKKILGNDDPHDAPIFYHPEIFTHLKQLIDTYEKAIETATQPVFSPLVHEAFYALKGSEDLLTALLARKTVGDRKKAFHDWFDGFKTLKFIHFLRDHQFPMCRAKDLVQPFTSHDLCV